MRAGVGEDALLLTLSRADPHPAMRGTVSERDAGMPGRPGRAGCAVETVCGISGGAERGTGRGLRDGADAFEHPREDQ